MTVSKWFSNGNNVRHYVIVLEAPHMVPSSANTSLNLIRDYESAMLPNNSVIKCIELKIVWLFKSRIYKL